MFFYNPSVTASRATSLYTREAEMVANSLAVGRVYKCQMFQALSVLPVTAALSVVIIDVCEG